MQRIFPLVNPVLRKRTLNVSIAFAIMQVSNWRRASNSSAVNNGAVAIQVSSPAVMEDKTRNSLKCHNNWKCCTENKSSAVVAVIHVCLDADPNEECSAAACA